MKIALLYICTGNYRVFWDEFYTSCEQYFITDAAKEYFVFTDAAELPHSEAPNVHVFHQDKLGWPYDTLMRFQIFSRVKDQLAAFDYIFFFNANAKFITPITAGEFLPGANDNGLVMVLHPGYYTTPQKQFPYEKKQSRSTAYMRKGEGTYYFQGCLNGGTAKAYLALITQLTNNVHTDLDNKIVAIWHDESHLNKYVADKTVKMLAPAYAYPQGWDLPFEPVISMRDKALLGGHDFLRGVTTPKKKSFLQKVRSLFK
jgi:hypothetical protein